MVKPISLRLHNAEILAKARATLIRSGRGDELKCAHTAAVMRKARATVARAKEQKRLKAVAALVKRFLQSVRPIFKWRNSTPPTSSERLGMREKNWL